MLREKSIFAGIKKPTAIVLSILLNACAVIPQHFDSHDRRLVGTWIGPAYLPLDIDYGEKTYFPNGTACGFILEYGGAGKASLTFYIDRWEIKDGRLLSEVDYTDDPYLSPGEVIQDNILEINSNYMRLQETDDPVPYYRYKIKEDRGQLLCELAHIHLHLPASVLPP